MVQGRKNAKIIEGVKRTRNGKGKSGEEERLKILGGLSPNL
jgi:hypothetical protein